MWRDQAVEIQLEDLCQPGTREERPRERRALRKIVTSAVLS